MSDDGGVEDQKKPDLRGRFADAIQKLKGGRSRSDVKTQGSQESYQPSQTQQASEQLGSSEKQSKSVFSEAPNKIKKLAKINDSSDTMSVMSDMTDSPRRYRTDSELDSRSSLRLSLNSANGKTSANGKANELSANKRSDGVGSSKNQSSVNNEKLNFNEFHPERREAAVLPLQQRVELTAMRPSGKDFVNNKLNDFNTAHPERREAERSTSEGKDNPRQKMLDSLRNRGRDRGGRGV